VRCETIRAEPQQVQLFLIAEVRAGAGPIG
jgi:hypothetical protein